VFLLFVLVTGCHFVEWASLEFQKILLPQLSKDGTAGVSLDTQLARGFYLSPQMASVLHGYWEAWLQKLSVRDG
jgi:desulfoferrodoxin (superoxide reductase-like protein)